MTKDTVDIYTGQAAPEDPWASALADDLLGQGDGGQTLQSGRREPHLSGGFGVPNSRW
jgi:hypothetical protein